MALVWYSRRALTISTGDVRLIRFVLVPCCGCTIAPCVVNVLFTRFFFVLVPCVYFCTVPAGVAYLLVEFVLVLWLDHCTVCTVFVL